MFEIQYNANEVIEDRIVYGNLKDDKGFYGVVLDGHGGW